MTAKKKKNTRKSGKNSSPMLLGAIRGALAALIVTVAAVLALALVIKQTGMDESRISAVNQIIKVASVFIAAFVASRGLMENLLAAGALSGLIYVVVGFLAFSLVEGSMGDLSVLLADAIMGVLVGGLVGLIFGKLLSKNKPAKKEHRPAVKT